ncbi:hypothetical protein B0H67DRAFT_552010 [Lasiosphaeris hirsuta]|uniref:Uncharacterized protein n=1 Tax=Lasiosphaeris hirsuta TaxID=260670 RepID=A0AA40APP1_9PEZI|nr:hypothetical protein B0H67DRAFT_552010 [Lasiosphaeris hirsuta]
MPLFTSRRHAHPVTTTHTTTVAPRRRGFFNRTPHTTRPAHGTSHTHVVHHQKRHVTMGDKISGALLRLKGSLTGRPGQKAAGTRRMNGTDGRGSHRSRRFF